MTGFDQEGAKPERDTATWALPGAKFGWPSGPVPDPQPGATIAQGRGDPMVIVPIWEQPRPRRRSSQMETRTPLAEYAFRPREPSLWKTDRGRALLRPKGNLRGGNKTIGALRLRLAPPIGFVVLAGMMQYERRRSRPPVGPAGGLNPGSLAPTFHRRVSSCVERNSGPYRPGSRERDRPRSLFVCIVPA